MPTHSDDRVGSVHFLLLRYTLENFVVTNLKQFSVFQHFKTDKNFLSGSHEIRIKGKRLHFKNSKYQMRY